MFLTDTTTELGETAVDLVRSLGLRPVGTAQRLPLGVMTYKFAVATATRASFVVCFYPDSRSTVVDYEPDLLRRCRQVGGRGPEVIQDSRNGPRAPLSYTVYRFIPGVPLVTRAAHLKAAAWRSLARELVAEFAVMRCVAFNGFGDPVTAQRARHPSWADFVRTTLRIGLCAATADGSLPAPMLGNLAALNASLDAWDFAPPARLVYGDVSMQNILVGDRDRFSGLLDFEGSLSGDELLALGYCYARYPDSPFFTALRDAWPTPLGPREQARIDLYSVVRAMRVAPYLTQPLPTGGAPSPLRTLFPGFEPALDALMRSGLNATGPA